MLRTIVIFIALVFACVLSYHAFATHRSDYFSACMILLLPFLAVIFLIGVMQQTGRVKGSIFQAVTFVAVSVFTALIVFEGILRVLKINTSYLERIGQMQYQSPYAADKKNGFWLLYPPNDSTNIFRGDFFYHRLFNSMGLAEREVDLKDTSTKKVLCLGDSFTEGIGTSADSSWPRVTERAINMCSKDSYTVYNAGVAGGDPVYNYHLLRGKLWDVKWDAVVFCVNATDITDVIYRGGMERFKPGGKVEFNKAPAWEPLFGALYMVRYAVLDIMNYDWKLHPASQAGELDRKAAYKISDALLQAHDELTKKGIEMMVIFLPLNYNVMDGKYIDDLDTVKSNIAMLKPVDLLPYFLDSAGINKSNYASYYWSNDGHLKTAGYSIVGSKVARELISRMNISCAR